MYQSFFKLSRKPFDLVPDPDFIYLSPSHKKALTYLEYGIRSRAGFILLTGEVGSGKTTLIRNILNKRFERVTLAKVFNTRVNSEQLLAMINDDFGLSVTGRDKVTLLRDLNDFLLEQFAEGNQPILIIDEAQNLSADLLEDIRMLSNLESSNSKLLQIILVGQPELIETLASEELMQLRQRIGVNCHLKPLSLEETGEYIVHRMTVAGNGEALELPAGTLDLIYQYSRGIPRLVNTICDFLMLSAFAEEMTTVSLEMAREVVGDLDVQNRFWGKRKSGERRQAGGAAQPDTQSEPGPDISAVLTDLCATLSLLREDFNAHVAKGEAESAELNMNLASLAAALERIEQQAPPGAPDETGFVRRLFGAGAVNGK